jgi:hypothetical protein
MKMNFTRYNRTFGLLVLPLLVVLIFITLFTEPVTGDLTRLGGYLEEDFGWRDPQQGFRESGFRLADSLDDYDRYYDVVVFGDSFSNDVEKGWQNVFYERTGLSIITLSMAKLATEAFEPSGVEIEAIINSPQFLAHPPRYFIFETVERDAFSRLHDFANKPWASDNQIAGIPVSQPIAFRQFSLPTQELRRRGAPGAEAKIQQAVNYLVKAASRLLGESEKTRVLDLTRSDLFSSGRAQQLLVVAEDMEKNSSADAVATAIRGMHAVQGLVEQNGKTRFLMLLFPDKLTTYTPYLKYSEQVVPSYLPALAAHYPIPRLDLIFQKELEHGAKDLYLPNDTHAGYLGHRLAADALVDFYLTGQNGRTQ